MPEILTPNLDRIRERLHDLRWLAGAGANLPGDQVCVRGQERRTLAWLIGTDLPDLIAEVERLRPPGEQTAKPDTPCWIVVRPDGARVGDFASTTHFPTAARALERVVSLNGTDRNDWTLRQLDQPCVTITCGGCNDTFDGGDSTVHFQDLEEAHTSIGESAEWNRWTILPDGSYLCSTCNPAARPAVVEAVASNA